MMFKTVEEARKRLGEDSFAVHDWQHGQITDEELIHVANASLCAIHDFPNRKFPKEAKPVCTCEAEVSPSETDMSDEEYYDALAEQFKEKDKS